LNSNGALSDASSLARWTAITGRVNAAVILEAARWGNTLVSVG
jgi:hypothetical protein